MDAVGYVAVEDHVVLSLALRGYGSGFNFGMIGLGGFNHYRAASMNKRLCLVGFQFHYLSNEVT